MGPAIERIVHQLIAADQEALIADWLRRLERDDMGDATELRREMQDLLGALRALLDAPDPRAASARQATVDKVLADASQLRAIRGQDPESSVRFVQGLRQALTAAAMAALPDPDQREAATERILAITDRCVTAQVTQFVAARESVIRSQAQSLLDMSTPVITLWDSILLLPLVGVVDSVRAAQIAERLLETIGRTEAEVTLIDVTGVPVMDTSVARHLLRTISAAEMLGTRVILTGISPDTAQTIVKLGIDMTRVPTRGSLKAGVALALQFTGRQLGASGAQ